MHLENLKDSGFKRTSNTIKTELFSRRAHQGFFCSKNFQIYPYFKALYILKQIYKIKKKKLKVEP